ncbi:MAG: hypothetical protein E6248_09090 [Clostridium sp.]|uniref:hypothetical protein n=1 Tax=Clostridium sp. TaxID=1506 RepID=UPI002910A605|nr:hypothetical protein [Clostridium sp.]MDU5110590.1 hypothetical protein [Clostridium sp.]
MKWKNILIISVCAIVIIFGGIKAFGKKINETKRNDVVSHESKGIGINETKSEDIVGNDINRKALGIDKINSKAVVSNEIESEIEDLEKVKSDTITKTFDGSYMSPLVTVSEYKPEFNIKLEGINKESELILINSYSGEMIKMDYSEDGEYILNTSLEKDVDYGILVDYRLTGSIRVVDDLKEINDEEIYNEIMENLQCGL